MRRYHQTKFGCKTPITSEDIYSRNIHIFYYIDKLNFHCDLTLMIATHYLDDSNPFFSHDTPAHNNAWSYIVWLHKV